jgi:hypothetical protein
MLAMCDATGYVGASIPGLANRSRLSLEECQVALDVLLNPDAFSRTLEHEGRRIEAAKGGWRILNYRSYRDARNIELKREQARQSMQQLRARRKSERYLDSENVTNGWPKQKQKQKDQNQDQDQRADAREAHRVLVRLAHDALAAVPIEDAKNELKTRAARAGIAYDARAISKALDSAEAQRKRG